MLRSVPVRGQERGGTPASAAHTYSLKISAVFAASGIVTAGHLRSHRLRDTFACDLLSKGVPLESVSKLLGHNSVKTTEQHYARWVQGRQDRLNDLVTGTWKIKNKK